MKKVAVKIVLLGLIVSLCGCSSANKLAVTYENGSTGMMSTSKLISLKTTDERAFNTIESVSGKAKIIEVSLSQDNIYNGYDDFSIVIKLNNGCTLNARIDSDKLEEIEGKPRPAEPSLGRDSLSSKTMTYISNYRNSFYNGDTIAFNNAKFSVYGNNLTLFCPVDEVQNMQ